MEYACSSERFCVWYGEASAYSAGVECPSTFDLSHSVWVESGGVHTGSGTSAGTFTFDPYDLPAEVKLCLYVNAEESRLVGESHPFNRRTGSEVLPHAPSPPPRAPARLSIWVHVVQGCKFKPHVRVNGEYTVGGHIAWALYKVGKHNHLTRVEGETDEAEDDFTLGEGYPSGTYRFDAHFLGDDNLQPSSTVAATFHLKRC